MPREDLILRCTECKEENYITTKNKKAHPEKMEIKKFCKRCNKMTVHKEKKYGLLSSFFVLGGKYV